MIRAATIAAITLLFAGCGSQPTDQANTSLAAPIKFEPVTIAELVKAYDENEAAAQTRYGGKWLAVTGKISAIDLDSDDKPVVRFEGDVMPSPSARFAEGYEQQAVILKKGETRVFFCDQLREVLASPTLENCQILEQDQMIDAGSPTGTPSISTN